MWDARILAAENNAWSAIEPNNNRERKRKSFGGKDKCAKRLCRYTRPPIGRIRYGSMLRVATRRRNGCYECVRIVE